MYQRGALYNSRRMVPTTLLNVVLPEGRESSPIAEAAALRVVACGMLEKKSLVKRVASAETVAALVVQPRAQQLPHSGP